MPEETGKSESAHFNLSPFLGLELGERWGREFGELSQRMTNLEGSVAKLENSLAKLDAKLEDSIAKLDAKLENSLAKLDAKFEAKFDALDAKVNKIAYAVHRLDERLTANAKLTWCLFGAILVAIIAQKLL